jgi:outer membrane protein, heavy metal efflux system
MKLLIENTVKMRKPTTFAIVLLAMSVVLSVNSRAQVMTLDSLLQLIDKQNPMLEEYDQNVKALEAYTGGARSWMAPMVGAGTFMTPYPNQMIMEE